MGKAGDQAIKKMFFDKKYTIIDILILVLIILTRDFAVWIILVLVRYFLRVLMRNYLKKQGVNLNG